MPDAPPYKLLYLAYACEPGRGSEWGLGWHYVDELSRTQPVWVITHADNQAGLDAYLKTKHKNHPVHVTYVKLPGWLGWMRNSFYSLYNVHYYLWQFAAARAAKKLHRAVKLDLVQHVSLFRWWMPSAGAALVNEGVGFIFGPVGGGELLPKGFARQGSLYSQFSDFLRWTARTLWRHDPLLKRTIRRAHLLVAGTEACEKWFKRYGAKNIVTICSAMAGAPEYADAARAARAQRPPGGPFTFASCGGLSYYRGVDLAVRAFAKANLPHARYVHVCDGPMRPKIEQLARELGVADKVQMLGDMPHLDCVRQVARADACVHTVLRDSQGALVETMLAGVPVITLDHLTPGMLVGDDCGTKIPIGDDTSPEQLVDRIAAAMRAFYDDRGPLAAMGEAAMARAATFSPEAKGAMYRAFHERVLRDVRRANETTSRAKGPVPEHAL
ncbi:MAG TPA: glycosyltransferase [Tepidisphaeraceae bacterium]